MSTKKTHREVKKPQISARYLADYMAASETAKRSIVQKCRYQPIAKVVQHDEAKMAVSKFLRGGSKDTAQLLHDAARLRERIADDEFDRDILDHNADYIERFAAVCEGINIPDAERLPPGQTNPIILHGVTVQPQLQFRLRRLTKSNKVRTGGGTLRYAKSKPLAEAIAEWQSAFLFGYLKETETEGSEPELAMCVTIDAYSGIAHPAPTDSVRRFQNIKSACASIFERWPNIQPPPKAVF